MPRGHPLARPGSAGSKRWLVPVPYALSTPPVPGSHPRLGGESQRMEGVPGEVHGGEGGCRSWSGRSLSGSQHRGGGLFVWGRVVQRHWAGGQGVARGQQRV